MDRKEWKKKRRKTKQIEEEMFGKEWDMNITSCIHEYYNMLRFSSLNVITYKMNLNSYIRVDKR